METGFPEGERELPLNETGQFAAPLSELAQAGNAQASSVSAEASSASAEAESLNNNGDQLADEVSERTPSYLDYLSDQEVDFLRGYKRRYRLEGKGFTTPQAQHLLFMQWLSTRGIIKG